MESNEKVSSPIKIKNLKDIEFNSTNLIEVLFRETEKNEDSKNIFKTYLIECPLEKSVKIYDVKLKGKGFEEDKFFKKNPQVLKILRRGNTIIELPKEKRVIGRKGFEKFFDLDDIIIENNLGKNNSEKKDVRDIIFTDIEKAFETEHKIKIFQTEKANGENCQFSFFKPLNAWLIASKNVSILARTRTDIGLYKDEKPEENIDVIEKKENEEEKTEEVEEYKQTKKSPSSKKEQKKTNTKVFTQNKIENQEENKNDQKNPNEKKSRFHFVKIIAEEWFNIIEKIPNIEELQKDLEGRTLVGEYCGNEKYQHLVKYDKTMIFLYALVENNGNKSCLPPYEVFELCSKFNLAAVKFVETESFSTFNDLNLKLKAIYDKISVSKIEEVGEGCVLYFLKERKGKNEKDEILSLCKIKTLEYRIFRKLREKIKHLFPLANSENDKKDGSKKNKKNFTQNDLLSKFKSESKELCKHYILPMDEVIYYELAEICLNYTKQYPSYIKIIKERYIDFIYISFYHFLKSKQNKIENSENDESEPNKIESNEIMEFSLKPEMFTNEKVAEFQKLKWSPFENKQFSKKE